MKMKAILLTGLLLLSCVGAAYAQLPAIKLKSIDGREVSTDTLNNNGKPFIISFFATYCKPCNRELNAIHEVYEDWVEETGVKLYAISIDEAPSSTVMAGNMKCCSTPTPTSVAPWAFPSFPTYL